MTTGHLKANLNQTHHLQNTISSQTLHIRILILILKSGQGIKLFMWHWFWLDEHIIF